MPYLTLAPLVLVKVPGVGDDYRVDYHYAGSVIPSLTDEQRQRFLDDGFVVEASDPGHTAAEHGDPGARPKQTAPKDAWVAYRVSQGVDHAEAEALTKQELIDLGE